MPVKPVWAVVNTPVAIRTVTYRGEPIGAPYEVLRDHRGGWEIVGKVTTLEHTIAVACWPESFKGYRLKRDAVEACKRIFGVYPVTRPSRWK